MPVRERERERERVEFDFLCAIVRGRSWCFVTVAFKFTNKFYEVIS